MYLQSAHRFTALRDLVWWLCSAPQRIGELTIKFNA